MCLFGEIFFKEMVFFCVDFLKPLVYISGTTKDKEVHHKNNTHPDTNKFGWNMYSLSKNT